MIKASTELALEATIEAHLLTPEAGYHRGDPNTYDPKLALIPAELLGYIQTTQPKTWAALEAIHHAALGDKLLAAFDKATAEHGLLHVLRQGLRFHGRTLRLVTFKPPSSLNPQQQANYAANRLLVVRQLHHDPKRPRDSLDMALFINGVPVVVIELKNQLTNQNTDHAKRQYREDRDPDTQMFRFKRRALIIFAVDADEVYMTTRLLRDQTHFLPFNQGIGTAAGNPAVPGMHRTAFLWERVLQRDSLLEIVGRFMHLERQGKPDERMIFPRYHQLDCVRKLEQAARDYGAGSNYLIQHSTGSGKSNSIAWLAHRLASLCDAADERVFHSVVVITDRKILDKQLQDTIFQLDHTPGVVHKIDKNSAQLAKALTDGLPVIITTLHKFGFIAQTVGTLPDRRYAIIVDEAHGSQTGDMRNNLKQLLADSSELARRVEELSDIAGEAGEDEIDPGQDLLRAALARGPLPNLSFFAFTATPKHQTLKVFGRMGPDGRYEPFHLYSMRQAIDEGFILDVLRGYTTYQRYFELIKLVSEDPRLDKRQATRALSRFVNAHPKNISSKIEVIVEHFHDRVRPLLGGRSRGMVVTNSRLQAVRFKLAFDTYVAAKGYDLRALVAFSGSVEDPKDPATRERPYTEPGMNLHYRTGKPISERGLAEAFDKDDYHLLIVANKYQTGFDQPRLCAMYVDKRLAGVQAVQTLSRLNRIFPGKDETFVLDFKNEREQILKCFQDYYERTTTAQDVDPDQLYTLQAQLEASGLLRAEEIRAFAAVFSKPEARQVAQDNAKLHSLLDPTVDRVRDLRDEGDEGAAAVERFRDQLRAFCRLYGFLGQVVPFCDPQLEQLYVFGKMLVRKLRKLDEALRAVDFDDDVGLRYYRLAMLAEGDLKLAANEGGSLQGMTATGTGRPKPQDDALSNLITRMNARFSTQFDGVQDLVDDVGEQLLGDTELRLAAQANDEANFAHKFNERLDGAVMDRYPQYEGFIDEMLNDEVLKGFFFTQIRQQIYARLRVGS